MTGPAAKLISIGIMLVVSLCLVTVTSYAWLTMSDNPVATGIQVSVGGSNTIKLAADISTVTEDGQVLHYPAFFSETLTLNEEADYLPLSPVSTADGINWYFPKEIKKENAAYTPGIEIREESSLQKDEFVHDDKLEYANIDAGQDTEVKGSYMYFDFWVVSPQENCELRVSVGQDGSGSYVINLPTVVKTEDSYQLDISNNEPSTYARVGFLVNSDVQTNDSMNEYVQQPQYMDIYKKLRGIYQEKGESASQYNRLTSYTIYEPNGDSHPSAASSDVYTNIGLKNMTLKDGEYVITSPISRVNGAHIATEAQSYLAVQKTSRWAMSDESESFLQQHFEAFLLQLGDKADKCTEEELMNRFYENWIQQNCAYYLNLGQFIPNSSLLYSQAKGDLGIYRYVKEESLAKLGTSGATDDAVIAYLEKNVPQRIRMYVYLEGQDVDCISNADVNSLIVHLELAGSN